MASSRPKSIHREFLDWDQPALPQAARRLAGRYRNGERLDLGQVLVVVPGQRAGRRLAETLVFLAHEHNLVLTPPEIITEGGLPEKLYAPKLPFADEIVQDLAWARALRELPLPQRKHIVPKPPAGTNAIRWLELGRLLRAVHVDLAAEGLDFAAVLRSGPQLADFGESDRWTALAALQQRYLALLDAEQLWDIQTARLKAIEFREIHSNFDIILLGTVDLTQTLRRMLDQVTGRVTAYIVAPDSLADLFDDYGCLLPEKWSHARVPFRDDQLEQVNGPADQAEAVADWLRQLGGRFRADDVTIGVPDESLVRQLQRQLELCGVPARWLEDVRIGESAPYRLLVAAVQFAGRRRYEDLAALLRHPDLENWLQETLSENAETSDGVTDQPSLLAQLDRYYNRHLPSRINIASAQLEDGNWPSLKPALRRITEWLEGTSTSQPLRAWGEAFGKLLGAVYGGRTLDRANHEQDVAFRILKNILTECEAASAIPKVLDAAGYSATDAFEALLRPLGRKTLPPPADPQAVEILGWLELPLDDAAAMVVTSFNEGFVPTKASGDAFLPDRLRRVLGLLHNERRCARDIYASSVLYHGRKELRVIFARRDARDDPLQPSRLLFACRDESLVRRAQRFFGKERQAPPLRRLLLAPDAAIPVLSRFTSPSPRRRGGGIRQIAVTKFRDFLACPYRYYLRHVEDLVAVDDAARELEASSFGSLLHSVLGAFGRQANGPRHSDSEREVFNFLAAELETQAKVLFDTEHRRTAIQLQLEQARLRLQAFAEFQAELVREGWRIVYAEPDNDEQLAVSFPPAGHIKPITLVGRIDRIDLHEGLKKLRILDYKTASTPSDPQKIHHNGTTWIDLQLPLYRHLVLSAGVKVPCNGDIELGYFDLPKSREDTQIRLANWTSEMLEEADAMAAEVIEKIRREEFGDGPTRPAPPYADDLSAICLDNVFRGPALEKDYGGDA